MIADLIDSLTYRVEIYNSIVDPILIERTLTGTDNILFGEDFLNELIKVTYYKLS